MKKIDEFAFNNIKDHLEHSTPSSVARVLDLSMATVMMAKGCSNYTEYRINVKARHPEIKYSLKDEVLWLHRTVFRKDNSYIEPSTARRAITELNLELGKVK